MVLFRGCKNTKKIEVQELNGEVLFLKFGAQRPDLGPFAI
jgi:hypothetical protein